MVFDLELIDLDNIMIVQLDCPRTNRFTVDHQQILCAFLIQADNEMAVWSFVYLHNFSAGLSKFYRRFFKG